MKNKLVELADKYEIKDFLKNDPSQFLYYYKTVRDTELCAFIAALLSFGSRKQFIPKINFIMNEADKSGGIYKWISGGIYKKTFCANDEKKFYRFYSYDDFYKLFLKLENILKKEKTLGEFIKKEYMTRSNVRGTKSAAVAKPTAHGTISPNLKITTRAPSTYLVDIIADIFNDCSIVPSTKTSAKKRLCMFLRWMVRDNSPVDKGLWTWYPKKDLIIPLDVHVLEEAKKLKLIPENAGATRKTAELLSKEAKKYFPEDPARLDFALFGLGVDKN